MSQPIAQRACILDRAFVRSLPRRLRSPASSAFPWIYFTFVHCIFTACASLVLISQPTAHARYLLALDFPSSSPPSSAPPIPLCTRLKVSGTLEGMYHMIQGVV